MPDKNDNADNGLNRRDFLGRGSALALGLLVGGSAALHAEELQAPTPAKPAPAAGGDTPAAAATPVVCAVIGLGEQGRAILTSLTNVAGANVKYVCDNYVGAHKRALDIVPKATAVTEYKKVLDDPAVQAVWVATPSHQHKEIALAAIAAGKHVYCESPLATTIEDAKAIAQAAKAAEPKLIFHSGLQQRSEPQHLHVEHFVRQGNLATIAQARAQWSKKQSWRRAAPTDERQNALNWRLNKATSPGLVGEIGIHQIDVASWYLKELPVAVTGSGGILGWKDGRDVPDTVQCLIEYPGGRRLTYNGTLTSSFDGAYELFQGVDASILMRGERAWMFKEVDSTPLGWEVYAYKEKMGDDTGIALVADASKLIAQGLKPGENRQIDPKKTPLYWACDHFLNAIREKKPTAAGPLEGYQATVVAIKANEAVMSNSRIALQKEWFTL